MLYSRKFAIQKELDKYKSDESDESDDEGKKDANDSLYPNLMKIGGQKEDTQNMPSEVRGKEKNFSAVSDKEEDKTLIERQKAVRREYACKERKRRNIVRAINLLLTYCRLMTTIGLLVGTLHQALIPRYLAKPENAYDDPYIFFIFMGTILADVFMFWGTIFWTWIKQIRLFCRLGFCNFLLWLMALFSLTVVFMYIPVRWVYQQLDETWCTFERGTPLSHYFDGRY